MLTVMDCGQITAALVISTQGSNAYLNNNYPLGSYDVISSSVDFIVTRVLVC